MDYGLVMDDYFYDFENPEEKTMKHSITLLMIGIFTFCGIALILSLIHI